MPEPLELTGNRRLGIENLSAFGLDPCEFIRIAGELGCGHVSLNLRGAANRLDPFPGPALRDEPALRRAVAAQARASGIAIALVEGFAILPGGSADDLSADLDHAAELGARAICVVSMERDLPRTHDSLARLTELAAARGLVTTTEVGAGVIRNLTRALDALAAVASPDFGLLVDTMHWFRGGASVADLAALPPGAVRHLQLCDVPMPAVIGDYMEEALFERRAPGDGDLPLAQAIAAIAPDVPIGLEVPIRSAHLAGEDARSRVARILVSARRLV